MLDTSGDQFIMNVESFENEYEKATEYSGADCHNTNKIGIFLHFSFNFFIQIILKIVL